jgi:ribosomal protein S18 acetylase RimI-like enzyme
MSKAVVLDLDGGFFLRHADTADRAALCRVCLKTGATGQDATGREDDPDLMGLVYAVPYQVLAPDFAFVVEGGHGVAGYLFGVPDTAVFNAALARDWYPWLRHRARDPGPDPARWQGSDWLRRMIHHPFLDIPEALAPFPSHGHIDLLPEARGRGIGRRCMEFLELRLRAAESAGIFLDVNPANLAAQRFYGALGYRALFGEGLPDTSVFMAKRLG